ncbi:hypothetical protein GCM10009680_69980 [Streptomyces yatensis]|uniref:Secreted peptide n=1 Tax=Streptomyces yatensis TaxID=155177 RepID=A0ABN2J6A8_9ACTN
MATAVVAITGVATTAAVAAAAEVAAVAGEAAVAAAAVVVAVAAVGAPDPPDPLATTRPYGRHAVLTVTPSIWSPRRSYGREAMSPRPARQRAPGAALLNT